MNTKSQFRKHSETRFVIGATTTSCRNSQGTDLQRILKFPKSVPSFIGKFVVTSAAAKLLLGNQLHHYDAIHKHRHILNNSKQFTIHVLIAILVCMDTCSRVFRCNTFASFSEFLVLNVCTVYDFSFSGDFTILQF